jgi:hypothetical protein
MKKLILIITFFTVLNTFGQVQTINSQLKLNNVTQGSLSDSILVKSSDGLVKYIKKSVLLTGTGVPGDPLDLDNIIIPATNKVTNGDFLANLSGEWKTTGSGSTVNITTGILNVSMPSFGTAYQELPIVIGHKYYITFKCKTTDPQIKLLLLMDRLIMNHI